MLNSNQLKVIAILCMIIDHIGYFLVSQFDYNLYIICRCIGRIAMPLFVFMIVEGFNHTKNFKKYIVRLLFIGIVTQLIILIFNKASVIKINNINILFSFVLSLVLLRCIDKKITKENKALDYILKAIVIIAIASIYYFINFDYGYIVPILAVLFYIINKVKNKDNIYLIYFIYLVLIPILSVTAIKNVIGICSIIASLFIILYNGKLGKKSKIIQYIYYFIYPLQYFILYSLSICFVTN